MTSVSVRAARTSAHTNPLPLIASSDHHTLALEVTPVKDRRNVEVALILFLLCPLEPSHLVRDRVDTIFDGHASAQSKRTRATIVCDGTKAAGDRAFPQKGAPDARGRVSQASGRCREQHEPTKHVRFCFHLFICVFKDGVQNHPTFESFPADGT